MFNRSVIFILFVAVYTSKSQSIESSLSDSFRFKLHQNNKNPFLNFTSNYLDSIFNKFAEETLIDLASQEIRSNLTEQTEQQNDGTSNQSAKRAKRETSNYRTADNEEYDVLNDKVGIFRLSGVYAAGRICPFNEQLINFNTITFGNQVISVCLTETRLVIGRIVDANPGDFLNSTIYWTGITEYRDVGFKQVDHFVKDKQIYFAIAKFGFGMPLLKLDPTTMKLVNLEQQTISSNPSTINIWQPKTWKANQKSSAHLKTGQTWNLAVANTESIDRIYDHEIRKKRDVDEESNRSDDNSTSPEPVSIVEEDSSNLNKKSIAYTDSATRSRSFKSTVSLFYFDTDSNYFDEYDRIQTFLVKDICTFSINNYDYLVVVNHKAGIKQHQVDSEIFKLDLHEGKWKSIQKIRTYGAVACEFFKFKTQDHPSEDEYFLVLANNHDLDERGRMIRQVNSVIYKFYYDQFIPFQCLHTVGASGVKFIKLHSQDNLELDSHFNVIKESDDYSSEKSVLAVSMQTGVQLYQYNGWKFVLSSVQYFGNSMAPSGDVIYSNDPNKLIDNYLRTSSKLFTFNMRDKSYLVVSNQLRLMDVNCFRMLFRHENQLGTWYQTNLNWCSSIMSNLQQNPQLFSYLANELGKTYSVNQLKPIYLNQVVFNNEMNFRRISSPVIVDRLRGKSYSDELIKPLISFNNQLVRVGTDERNIHDLIVRSLKLRTQRPQVVSARLDFDNLKAICSNELKCSISSIQTNQLNRYNVSNMNSRLVRTNLKDFLWGNQYNFDHVTMHQQLNVYNQVNNQVLNDNLITKSGNHRFQAPTVLNFSPFVKYLNVSNLLNRRRFNVKNVLLNDVNQYLPLPIEFEKSVEIIGNLNVNGLVNGFAAMNDLINSIVTRYSNVTIDSAKNFAKGIQVGKLIMTETSTFNGFNLVDTYENLFWLNKDISISAPINFTNLHVKGNLIVDGLINGVNIAGNDFVIANQTNVINSLTTFKSPVSVNYLQLNRSLNSVPTIFNQLDLFMRNIPQRILAPKHFKSVVHLNGNANVQGMVDGVKLSAFAQELESRAKRNYYNGLVTIEGNASFLNNLFVQGLVNGVRLNDLLANALRTDQTLINGFKEIIFTSITTPTLKARKINNLNLERDLMLRGKSQVIYGVKRFTSGLFAQDNFNISRLNQYEIGKNDLHSDVLLRDVSQHITGHKVIKGDLHVDNLIVGNLNGLDMNKLFTLKKDGNVFGPLQFNQDVQFESYLSVDSIDRLNSANNILMNDLLINSLRYRLPQTITGVKGFKKILEPRQTNLQVEQINEIRLNDFFASIVYRDIPNQIVTGKKVFQGEVTINEAKFKQRWDGISASELKGGFVHQNQDKTINGNLLIRGDSHFAKSLIIRSDILNNVYLPKFFETFVPLDKPAYLKGKIDLNSVEFQNDVQVAGRINNLDVNRDIVLNDNKQQVIYGRKQFENVYVRNHLELRSGHFNEINLDKFFANTLRRNSNRTVHIKAPVIVHGNVIAKSVNVNNRINNIDLNALKRNILVDYRVNRSTVITGRKHFDTLILDGPSKILNNGDFSGINLQLLDRTYLSLSRAQKVNNPIVFNNVIDVEKVTVKGNLDVRRINNVNVDELFKNSLKSTGDQVVNSPIIFKGNVRVDKNIFIANDQINKVRLNQDLMIRNRPVNVFYHTKRFVNGASIQHLITRSTNRTNVNLVCLSTGKAFDLLRFINDAIFNDGHTYNVSQLKQFRRVVVDDIVIRSEVNGISFNERNLFINSPTAKHVIGGNILLRGPIYAKSKLDVRQKVNGQNLIEFAKDAVQRNRRQHVIKGEKLILGSMEVDNLVVLGNIHGYNITNLARQALRPSINSTSVKRALNDEDTILNRIDYCLKS